MPCIHELLGITVQTAPTNLYIDYLGTRYCVGTLSTRYWRNAMGQAVVQQKQHPVKLVDVVKLVSVDQ